MNELVTKVIKIMPELTDEELVKLSILLERELRMRMNREEKCKTETEKDRKG